MLWTICRWGPAIPMDVTLRRATNLNIVADRVRAQVTPPATKQGAQQQWKLHNAAWMIGSIKLSASFKYIYPHYTL